METLSEWVAALFRWVPDLLSTAAIFVVALALHRLLFRSLIVALNCFIERPFQNWTRGEARLIGSVILYIDHRAPVDTIRAKLDEVLKAISLWDGVERTGSGIRGLFFVSHLIAASSLPPRPFTADFDFQHHPQRDPDRDNERQHGCAL